MKKLLFFVTAAVFFLAGCADAGLPADHQQGRLSVVASFYPMYDFAQKIGGDRADVSNLVPAGTEPHDWEPSTSDIVKLEKADVFVYNGLGMEHWTDKVLSSLQNKDLKTVMASNGVEKPGLADPHVWLNPLYAKKELENIKDAFRAADPANEAYYQRNYEKYAAELDALHGEYQEAAARFTRKDVVVDHAAFYHLCTVYGLKQVPVEGLSAESEPDAARMALVVDFVRENGVKVIFFEEIADPGVAEAIARETGAQTGVLNPLEGLGKAQIDAGDEYFSVMRRNLVALKEALE